MSSSSSSEGMAITSGPPVLRLLVPEAELDTLSGSRATGSGSDSSTLTLTRMSPGLPVGDDDEGANVVELVARKGDREGVSGDSGEGGAADGRALRRLRVILLEPGAEAAVRTVGVRGRSWPVGRAVFCSLGWSIFIASALFTTVSTAISSLRTVKLSTGSEVSMGSWSAVESGETLWEEESEVRRLFLADSSLSNGLGRTEEQGSEETARCRGSGVLEFWSMRSVATKQMRMGKS